MFWPIFFRTRKLNSELWELVAFILESLVIFIAPASSAIAIGAGGGWPGGGSGSETELVGVARLDEYGAVPAALGADATHLIVGGSVRHCGAGGAGRRLLLLGRSLVLVLLLILGVVDLLRRCTLRRLLVFGGGGGGPGGVGVGSRSVSQRSAEGRRRVTHVARHGAAGGRPAGRHGRPRRRQRGSSLRYGHIRPLFSSLNRPLHSWIFPLWSSISTLSLD